MNYEEWEMKAAREVKAGPYSLKKSCNIAGRFWTRSSRSSLPESTANATTNPEFHSPMRHSQGANHA